jgi:hypothetical protein
MVEVTEEFSGDFSSHEVSGKTSSSSEERSTIGNPSEGSPCSYIGGGGPRTRPLARRPVAVKILSERAVALKHRSMKKTTRSHKRVKA